MLKTAGALMVGAACICLGFHAAWRLHRRDRLLQCFLGVTEQIKTEIGSRLTALPELLAGLKRDRPELSGFFTQIESQWNRDDYLGFSEAWREALEELDLTLEDKLLLAEIGNALGRYDADTQVVVLERTLNALRQQRDNAHELRRKNTKLYRVLGLVSGVIAVILII